MLRVRITATRIIVTNSRAQWRRADRDGLSTTARRELARHPTTLGLTQEDQKATALTDRAKDIVMQHSAEGEGEGEGEGGQ